MKQKVGRPAKYASEDEPMKVSPVRLTFWHRRKAKKLGNGCLATGIRHALESTNEPVKEEE